MIKDLINNLYKKNIYENIRIGVCLCKLLIIF